MAHEDRPFGRASCLLQEFVRRANPIANALSRATLVLIVVSLACAATLQTDDSSTSQENSGSVQALALGQLVKHQIAGGQTRSYEISLKSGDYLRVVVNNLCTQLAASLLSPGGQKIAEIESRRCEPAALSFIAEAAGACRLEVSSFEKSDYVESYEVVVENLQQAAAMQRVWLAAEKATAEAEQHRAQWTLDSLQKAIRSYEEARSYWEIASDKQREARALKSMGDVYCLLSENLKALNCYSRALKQSRSAESPREEIDALNGIGYCYIDLGETQKSLKYCNDAYALSRELGERRGEAQALTYLGLAHYVSTNFQKSLAVLQQALAYWEDLRDRRGQAETLNNLGYLSYDLGETKKALDYYSRALALWRAVADNRGQALSLTAMGGVYTFLGDKQKALDLHNEAIQILQALGDRNGQAVAFNGIGYVYDDLGYKERALYYYNLALKLFGDVRNSNYEALTLGYIGRIYDYLGAKRKALTFYNRKLVVSNLRGERRMEAYTLRDIGLLYEFWGNIQKALSCYTRALSLSKDSGDVRAQSYILSSIGHINEISGLKHRALGTYDQALHLIRAVEDRRGEISILYNIARVERDLGHLGDARRLIETAINIIEALRTKVNSPELRYSYFASTREYYELYINVLMRMHKKEPLAGFDAVALEASERGRARTFLEMLTESSINIREGISPDLRHREQSLRQELDARLKRKMQLLAAKALASEIAMAQEGVDALLSQLQETQAQIRLTSPHYAALTQPAPLTVPAIQQLLGSETILLEYAVGNEASYLWAVTDRTILSYELPGRAGIEPATRSFLDLITKEPTTTSQSSKRPRTRSESPMRRYEAQAKQLSQILIGPAASQIGNKRLLIVAEGVLQFVPFSALSALSQGHGGKIGRHIDQAPPSLITEHEIVSLPSASSLSVLRREIKDRQPAPKTVAVLADPVFKKDDSRVIANRRNAPAINQRSRLIPALNRDAMNFERLLASRREAEIIMSLVPPGQGLKATDFEANLALATSPEMSNYRIVHFATHGFLDSEHPELSGVVLSLVDEQGNPQNGFLRAYEIYNLRFPAELIVLSACDTALGKDITGEGLVGITRGFMYAGAARLLSSLWKVDDYATSEFMRLFYERVLNEGTKPAAALRAAQIELQKQERWRFPFYWAAFVVQGEWE